jgi:excisionase family DNA binding protein
MFRNGLQSHEGRTMTEAYVTIKEVERYTGLPRSWLYAKAAAGEIPHLKVGKYLRFRLSEVEAWLAQHRRGVTNGDAGENQVADDARAFTADASRYWQSTK